MNYYFLFNEFVGDLEKILSDETMILIISDHGQEKGIHTNHGFYSCNKKLDLINPKIIDLKKIIENKIIS